MSSQAFAFVLILAILLVAAFLNLAYNVVPNIRAILNGVLGLDKEHCVEGPKASPTNIQESKTDSDSQYDESNNSQAQS